MKTRNLVPLLPICVFVWLYLPLGVHAEFRVGAAKVDISPDRFPVLVNGSMTSRTADSITTRIHARALVLDDKDVRIGLCVVDSCMLPRAVCDEAKALTAQRTGLSAEHIMISATHTHTAPSSMGALGTDADPYYVSFLRQKIAEALQQAEANLQPAQVGWGSVDAPNFTALRRWVRRPDRIAEDPFGNATVRATMHAARNPEDAIGPTGPEDPELSLIAFRNTRGKPIAVLSNFSMHYFGGEQAISADYFGYFCERFSARLAPEEPESVVAIMSHGCSGDIWKRDYMTPRRESEGSIVDYSTRLLDVAQVAYDAVEYRSDADLAMSQTELSMQYRTPDVQRLAWAKQMVQEMGNRLPQTQPEIYAREQLFLDEWQKTNVVLQAIRIGDIAISTTPNETYALTGLKIKLQSPFENTMVIELANGGDGYIPPPEQHALGGYNTWPARSAGLEVTAEPRIVAASLLQLEQVCDLPRRSWQDPSSASSSKISQLEPWGYWKLGEFAPPIANDASGNGRNGVYEPNVLFFLEGPSEFSSAAAINRCVHFAGGRLRIGLPESKEFSLLVSFWNGMPIGTRDELGWMFSRDFDHSISDRGVHLGLNASGTLRLKLGTQQALDGKTVVDRWQWARAAVVCDGQQISVYLNDAIKPEITANFGSVIELPAFGFLGGRSDHQSNWEGRLDEIAVFDRALSRQELAQVLDNSAQ